jgi:glycosyltransferase involved in cell wall biosynthesis
LDPNSENDPIATDSSADRFRRLNCCVIIPTYNNASTIAAVIRDVSKYTKAILVINDGSYDGTAKIASSFPYVRVWGYEKNRGKGWAIRKGFELARESGYDFAITIDSDGQHYARDLSAFLDQLEKEKKAIIIGERDLNQANVPGKSSFGNRFSNFWFKVETGITLEDTQSGYRLYPLLPLEKIRFRSIKYEFEVEVIVRAAWAGVKVYSIPVSVYYPPKEERVSHFRPWKDTIRISFLNSLLVLETFIYVRPLRFFRTIFTPGQGREYIRKHLLQVNQPDHIKAISVGFGFLMGIMPIWGFQLITAIALSILFKLNKALVIVAAHISFAPFIPFIIYLSFKAGSYWVGDKARQVIYNRHMGLSSIRHHFYQYLAGSLTLALLAGISGGIITYLLIKLLKLWPASPNSHTG